MSGLILENGNQFNNSKGETIFGLLESVSDHYSCDYMLIILTDLKFHL
jgi:hypothetical protein